MKGIKLYNEQTDKAQLGNGPWEKDYKPSGVNVPNKICLAWEYSQIDVLPPGVTSKKVFGKDVEYIRKDALVEWLKERINNGDEEGLMTNQIANLAYKDVMDKISSL